MDSRAICAVVALVGLVAAGTADAGEPENPLAASLPLQQAFGTANDIYAEAGARGGICIASRDVCRRLRKEAHITREVPFKSLRIAQLTPTEKVIVYEALDDPRAIQINLWTYTHSRDSFESFSRSVSEVGRYRIIGAGPLAGHVVFAEFLPDAKENRYGGHRFRIDVERWMGAHQGWLDVLSYLTPERFKGETEESEDLIDEDIFDHEMPRIQALLKQVYPEMKPRIARPY